MNDPQHSQSGAASRGSVSDAPADHDQALTIGLAGAAPSPLEAPVARLEQLGRYLVRAELGRGGFGVVYQGYDAELKRDVALKVPRAERVTTPAGAEAYLAEARMVATLDHPGIVPVYDVGRTDDGLCYMVSKLVVGSHLGKALHGERPPHPRSAELVAQVAEALHHAHQRGLVHRDIKPANILLDDTGRALVADFGLALRDEDYAQGAVHAGTWAYMSPEQARGEGHRVDGRSDIYSLGIVFYELMTGRIPYRTREFPAILDEIASGEVRPPRQVDATVPRELDRICLKALAQRAADRYSTAGDLAEDLRHWLATRGRKRSAKKPAAPLVTAQGAAPAVAPTLATPPAIQMIVTPGSGATPTCGPSPLIDTDADSDSDRRRALKIVPKGLRSFDAADADFFLELLPGPTDRDGLPESIRFWKRRIEETDPERTFTVGLCYGPSGCGKSSLFKAGLLPRLAPHVKQVYIEATPADTEARLLRALAKEVPGCLVGLAPTVAAAAAGAADGRSLSLSAGTVSLHALLSALRRGRGLAPGEKVVLILDQFEQWLHAHREGDEAELIRALRQCDGGRVQCIALVRDDFGMAATRFMDALEAPLLQGYNFATVDLFDLRHARKVLAHFGRAFGQLPETGDVSPEQERFLADAAAALAEEGQVVSVRLALFAEMVKGKPWTPAMLREVGGMEGVGVTFLEETFAASGANPHYRRRQHAARAVLAALLPDTGTDIKGQMRPREELLAASGLANQPRDFDDLLRILDAELRLITPTEAEGGRGSDEPGDDPSDPSKIQNPQSKIHSYQLTHDYLVPSLRDWLTRRQRETRHGRAELRLAECSAAWSARPEPRHLPAAWEVANIGLFTRSKTWTTPQRRMMRAATWRHGSRWLAGMVALVAAILSIGYYVRGVRRNNDLARTATLVEAVLSAPADGVPYTLENLRPFRDLALPRLRIVMEDSNAATSHRLHAACALADLGDPPVDFLLERVADAPDAECRNIVTALGHADMAAVKDRLVGLAADAAEAQRRFRFAATALWLGDPRGALASLVAAPDPVHRTTFILGLRSWRADLAGLVDLLRGTDDTAFRSGLCQALGRFTPDSVADADRRALIVMFQDVYANAADGGTHSAAGWALWQWGVEPPAIAATKAPTNDRRWFVNSVGMTLVEIPVGAFTMGTAGASSDSGELPHEVTLTRPFHLADREVTIGQFQAFIDDPDPAVEMPIHWEGAFPFSGSTPEYPVQQVNWFDAVLFCNWLSRREARTPCYARTGEKYTYAPGTDYTQEWDVWTCDFEAAGYRLPTESEWEYACRSGTTTSFSFGEDENLLADYGISYANSKLQTWQGATKLPSAWGLFDMHGNVWEWCWDGYGAYSPNSASDPSGGSESDVDARVIRGGGWNRSASSCRSAGRYYLTPTARYYYRGFRVGVRLP